MAVVTIPVFGAAKRYLGLSSDTKPGPATNETISRGSTFDETDTGKSFRWNGSEWLPVEGEFPQTGAAERTAQLLERMLAELRRVRFGLELYLGQEFPDPGE